MADNLKVDISEIIDFYEEQLKKTNKDLMLVTMERNHLQKQLNDLVSGPKVKATNTEKKA